MNTQVLPMLKHLAHCGYRHQHSLTIVCLCQYPSYTAAWLFSEGGFFVFVFSFLFFALT